jgi:hypothetical protein
MGNAALRVAVVDVFRVRAQGGAEERDGSYTGNTKVPIRTSNSQRYMKYKCYREK